MHLRALIPILVALSLAAPLFAAEKTLPNTAELKWEGDLAARMVAGIGKHLDVLIETGAGRSGSWILDFASAEAYAKSIAPRRERFAKIIGVVDPRVSPTGFELVGTLQQPALIARGENYKVYAVRWGALDGVDGEGLLLEPDAAPVANIVALPEADWTPEQLVGLAPGVPEAAQYARRLAENRCRVVVPVLINRESTHSGNARLNRWTNQPHREFVYRAAYQMGRHVIGYEVQKVLAAIDNFRKAEGDERPLPVGVIGYGEGGLIAFYSAALDTRIGAAAVSGYFGPRRDLWKEPIYRNVWSLTRDFGDAEIAAMIHPRQVIVDAVSWPKVPPPAVTKGRAGAAPTGLTPLTRGDIELEFTRFKQLVADQKGLLWLPDDPDKTAPGADPVLTALTGKPVKPSGKAPTASAKPPDAAARMKRQFDQLNQFTQKVFRLSEFTRRALFAKADTKSAEKFATDVRLLRDHFRDEVIGRLPAATLPANARSRVIYDEPKWTGYEIVLDVYDDVFAYGILCLPKDIKPGEKRPVVVCQHGLEGRPQHLADPRHKSVYHSYAAALADRGFITYSPQNPYIGRDDFRVLQRKANPLKLSLFSFIVAQHERTLAWLATLPYVDPDRIGLYGLSYGGKTAMRVPAIIEKYCLSICSADFNEWILKNVSIEHNYSYMFTGEYEMFEFDLGNTFNYAEMADLIFPRPFMVERGHGDGVAPDEWVAYEFAKIKRRYDLLGHGDRAELEVFVGGHEIHSTGTFEFLHKHLRWPKR